MFLNIFGTQSDLLAMEKITGVAAIMVCSIMHY